MIVPESLSNREPVHSAKLLLAGLFFALSFASHELFAAEYNFQSSLTSFASSIWRTDQDNDSDNSAEPESVLTFIPQASLSIMGKQADINAEFGVLHRISADTGSSITTPQVKISALSRVFGNTYSVGAIARSSGRFENANSSVDGIIEDSDEIPVIHNFEIQQHATTRIGSKAVLRALHSSAITQSNVDSDTASNSHALEFASDALLTRAGVIGSVRGGYQLINYENDLQGSNGTLRSELKVPLSAAVTMNAAAGYESIRSDQTDLELDGEALFLGLKWEPIERLSAELGYGKRVFGESPRAKLSYFARRSGILLSWTRTLQSYKLSGIAEGLEAINIVSSEIDATTIAAEVISDEEVLNFNGLDSSAPFLNQQSRINEIVTLQMFFKTLRTKYSAVFAYVENEDIEDSSIAGTSEKASFQAVREFGKSLDIGLEAAFSGDVDDSDNRSTRRKISLFSEWRF